MKAAAAGSENIAVGVVRFEGAAVVFVESEGAAIGGNIGIAVVDTDGKGGVPAKAQGTVHRAFEVAGLAVGTPFDDTVAAIAAFQHLRHAPRLHPQDRLSVVVGAGRVEDVVGVGEVRETEEKQDDDGGVDFVHGRQLNSFKIGISLLINNVTSGLSLY